jgi:hypothetical protein
VRRDRDPASVFGGPVTSRHFRVVRTASGCGMTKNYYFGGVRAIASASMVFDFALGK